MSPMRVGGILSIVKLMFSVCMFALTGCAASQPPAAPEQALPLATSLPPPVLVESDRPVILLYRDNLGGMAQSPANQLDAAVWADGRIVWRANRTLLQGQLDPKRIDDLLQRLHREGVFGNGDAYYGDTGPDGNFEVIEIRLLDRSLKLAAWHERFAQNPKLVVTSRGVESLNGRDPQAVLAYEPEPYQRFRRIWSDIRSAVKSWEPPTGEPFEGSILIGPGT